MKSPHVSPWGSTSLIADLHLPTTSVEVLSFDLTRHEHHALREDDCYRLDLSLNPRLAGSVLRFADRWAPQRYEAPGKLFLLPPRENVRIRNGIGHQDAIICRLPLERLTDWLECEPDWSDQRLDASLDILSPAICHLVLELGKEAREPGFGSAVLCESLAVQIAIALERYFRQSAEPPCAGGLSARQLRLIDERIGDLASAPDLTELAAVCGLSVRQVSRAFRASRGQSLGAHVAAVRMDKARQMLASGESVKAIAYRMGFGSPNSFSYAFRRQTGLAPRDFRQRSAAR